MRGEWVDGAKMGSRFGMGEAVPAAGCGFRRACLWERVVFLDECIIKVERKVV
jgi:hypothetical protein